MSWFTLIWAVWKPTNPHEKVYQTSQARPCNLTIRYEGDLRQLWKKYFPCTNFCEASMQLLTWSLVQCINNLYFLPLQGRQGDWIYWRRSERSLAGVWHSSPRGRHPAQCDWTDQRRLCGGSSSACTSHLLSWSPPLWGCCASAGGGPASLHLVVNVLQQWA